MITLKRSLEQILAVGTFRLKIDGRNLESAKQGEVLDEAFSRF